MRNIALKLTYLGTAYHGWQVQKNLPTVGETLEKAAAMVVDHPVHMTGCGRTDAGVHANAQVFHFDAEWPHGTESLFKAMRCGYPKALQISKISVAKGDFHARYSVKGKRYIYRIYEGYAPGGVGLIVEVTTDNKNRAIGEVRNVFTKNGGNLASSGALTSFFQRKGQIIISADAVGEDELMEIALEAGAEDVKNNGDFYEVITAVGDYDAVAKALDDKQIKSESSDLVYLPNVEVPVTDADTAKKIQKLIDALEDLDDVKAVHSNDDIADGLLDA